MSEEDDAIILDKKQLALLEEIRKEKDVNTGRSQGYTGIAVDKIQRAHGDAQEPDRRDTGRTGSVEAGTQGNTSNERVVFGPIERGGPTLPTHINTLENDSPDGNGYQEAQDTSVTRDSNDDKERRQVLNRQRQERYRDKQKQAQNSAVTVTNGVTPNGNDEKIRFSLKETLQKLPLPSNVTHNDSNAGNAKDDKKSKPEIKLITSKEADEFLEPLTYIYLNGSGLLDDILQVIVKGHEEVTIWQLDEDEAEQLAKMHLSKAKVSKEASASARKLIELYDKTYFIMLLGPRAFQTGKHVVSHGGLSFK
jgi:hypothetical protein